jgi:hypothetical protein
MRKLLIVQNSSSPEKQITDCILSRDLSNLHRHRNKEAIDLRPSFFKSSVGREKVWLIWHFKARICYAVWKLPDFHLV